VNVFLKVGIGFKRRILTLTACTPIHELWHNLLNRLYLTVELIWLGWEEYKRLQ